MGIKLMFIDDDEIFCGECEANQWECTEDPRTKKFIMRCSACREFTYKFEMPKEKDGYKHKQQQRNY